jgi:hypothetical protein
MPILVGTRAQLAPRGALSRTSHLLVPFFLLRNGGGALVGLHEDSSSRGALAPAVIGRWVGSTNLYA